MRYLFFLKCYFSVLNLFLHKIPGGISISSSELGLLINTTCLGQMTSRDGPNIALQNEFFFWCIKIHIRMGFSGHITFSKLSYFYCCFHYSCFPNYWKISGINTNSTARKSWLKKMEFFFMLIFLSTQYLKGDDIMSSRRYRIKHVVTSLLLCQF